MNLITPLLPTIRVWIFGAVLWLLARANLPAEHAEPITGWLMEGLAGLATFSYGVWAAWREKNKS